MEDAPKHGKASSCIFVLVVLIMFASSDIIKVTLLRALGLQLHIIRSLRKCEQGILQRCVFVLVVLLSSGRNSVGKLFGQFKLITAAHCKSC